MDTRAELSDADVVEAVRGGPAAIEVVARSMSDRVRLMVYARLNPSANDTAAVDDITQQSLEALMAGLPTLKLHTAAGLRSYASTIVSRRVADFLRDPAGVGRGRRGPASLDSTVAGLSTAGPLWQFLSDSATSPLSAAVRENQLERVMNELSQMRDEYRAVITMAFFDQLTTAQIAEQTGTTRHAAAMSLLRAVRALRERLGGGDAAD